MLDDVSMHSKPRWPSMRQAVCEAGHALRLKKASLRRARARAEGTARSWQVLVVGSQVSARPVTWSTVQACGRKRSQH